jgi:hypothetical protein
VVAAVGVAVAVAAVTAAAAFEHNVQMAPAVVSSSSLPCEQRSNLQEWYQLPWAGAPARCALAVQQQGQLSWARGLYARGYVLISLPS